MIVQSLCWEFGLQEVIQFHCANKSARLWDLSFVRSNEHGASPIMANANQKARQVFFVSCTTYKKKFRREQKYVQRCLENFIFFNTYQSVKTMLEQTHITIKGTKKGVTPLLCIRSFERSIKNIVVMVRDIFYRSSCIHLSHYVRTNVRTFVRTNIVTFQVIHIRIFHTLPIICDNTNVDVIREVFCYLNHS